MSALQDAVSESDRATVKRLVAEGADVAEADAYGYTVLLHAAF
jgi:ankyrin repeat protein